MNSRNNEYLRFGLCIDMMRTVSLIKDFDAEEIIAFAKQLKGKSKFFVSGEGSSRIFPAKNMIYHALQYAPDLHFYTEAGLQSLEYNLDDYVVLGVSNSGKTSELIRLFYQLKAKNHKQLYGITSNTDTFLESLSNETHVLKCGKEKSVAATISVIEQALFFDVLLSKLADIHLPSLAELSEKFQRVLSTQIESSVIDAILNAKTLYFAGRNTGVAEELTLKANEIIRKRSDFLEGTYAVHGIEEVMTENDVMILIDPYKEEEEKFEKYISKGAGVTIIAIADRPTLFPTIQIPEIKYFNTYLQIAAGWNILLECGLKMGINLDKPQRARKIGNEFITITK